MLKAPVKLSFILAALLFQSNAKAYTWYEILGVSQTASAEEILRGKTSFHKLAVIYHPDKWNEHNTLGPNGVAISKEETTEVYEKLADSYREIGAQKAKRDAQKMDDFLQSLVEMARPKEEVKTPKAKPPTNPQPNALLVATAVTTAVSVCLLAYAIWQR